MAAFSFKPSVTVREVARSAGVSIATVSRVLNRTRVGIPISEATRVKVLESARQLGYRANTFARSLRTQTSQTVGLVVQDIRDPFFSEIIAGLEQAASELGYFYLLSSAADSARREEQYLDIFHINRVDGILAAGVPEQLTDAAAVQLTEAGVPVVLIGRTIKDHRIGSVCVDNPLGTRLAMKHLLDLGHVRIGHLAGLSSKPDARVRFETYRRSLERAGLAYDPALVVEGQSRPEDGYAGMRRLLALAKPPTAVFCYSDLLALGALKAAREAGFAAPGKLSVIGFDDLDLCRFTEPELTTVRQPRFEMGYEAMKLFVRMDRKPKEAEAMVLKPELVVRGSTERRKS